MAEGDTVIDQAATPEFSMDIVKAVLKKSLYAGGLYRGLHECCKALERRQNTLFCALAEDCDEQNYVALVEALCAETGVPIIKVPARADLGEWVGLCKYDTDGSVRKTVNCSVAVCVNPGEETSELLSLKSHLEELQ